MRPDEDAELRSEMEVSSFSSSPNPLSPAQERGVITGSDPGIRIQGAMAEEASGSSPSTSSANANVASNADVPTHLRAHTRTTPGLVYPAHAHAHCVRFHDSRRRKIRPRAASHSTSPSLGSTTTALGVNPQARYPGGPDRRAGASPGAVDAGGAVRGNGIRGNAGCGVARKTGSGRCSA